MKTFIKVTEIWEPDNDKEALRLVSGQYGDYKAFGEQSRAMTFGYDDGLPGKAWAAKHPVMLTELEGSCFKRTEMARAIGITTAIALPIFAGEFLHAVVLFLCGDEEARAGAIEIWAKEPEQRREMGLVEGYYGSMEDLSWISRKMKITRGQDLPGRVWESSMPYILKDPDNSPTFLRARKVPREGISTALAFPAWMIEEDGYVISFLSAKEQPIARRFEIWIPDDTGDALIFRDGYCDERSDLDSFYAMKRYGKENSLIGKAWKTGHPLLTENPKTEEDDVAFDSLLALPILQNGFCKAVVTFYN